ncbi:nicotinamidase-related amidase [Sphingomonas zeicaulis]|uniref:cysteine hydrolase family protein n=1 Tax=Sphingomonas zeicaulis TaxID=1632740 RepID=UPI003D236054
MDPKTTALVLIEYQNDFVTPGGAQHDAVKDVMQSNDMLANSVALLEGAREAGITVLHVPIAFAEGYPEIAPEPYGILAGVVGAKAFRKGSWGAEIAAPMAPLKDEIIVEGKRGLDCFASTNIDFILRQHGIANVAIAGFLTNCCVESTMRSAYERGFRVVTLTDCCATIGEEEQKVAITKDFPMFSLPMTQEEFLGGVAG